jgi:hypothetical protein
MNSHPNIESNRHVRAPPCRLQDPEPSYAAARTGVDESDVPPVASDLRDLGSGEQIRPELTQARDAPRKKIVATPTFEGWCSQHPGGRASSRARDQRFCGTITATRGPFSTRFVGSSLLLQELAPGTERSANALAQLRGPILERTTGFEPATPTLARWCSTS